MQPETRCRLPREFRTGSEIRVVYRVLTAIAIKEKLSIKFYDIKTAYLHRDLEETIDMAQPLGYRNDSSLIRGYTDYRNLVGRGIKN